MPTRQGKWQQFERTGWVEAVEYVGQDLSGVSVSEEDTPTPHDGYICRNPDQPDDQWYVNAPYFHQRYTPAQDQPRDAATRPPSTLDSHGNALTIGNRVSANAQAGVVVDITMDASPPMVEIRYDTGGIGHAPATEVSRLPTPMVRAEPAETVLQPEDPTQHEMMDRLLSVVETQHGQMSEIVDQNASLIDLFRRIEYDLHELQQSMRAIAEGTYRRDS